MPLNDDDATKLKWCAEAAGDYDCIAYVVIALYAAFPEYDWDAIAPAADPSLEERRHTLTQERLDRWRHAVEANQRHPDSSGA